VAIDTRSGAAQTDNCREYRRSTGRQASRCTAQDGPPGAVSSPGNQEDADLGDGERDGGQRGRVQVRAAPAGYAIALTG
jgi:hypothetical protein